ncbi:type IV pilus response regulator PilH [Pseudomonas sp. StFLB209]|nr:type IV pilus response regulator PilH [Pseudomonas sp. StFLB209]
MCLASLPLNNMYREAGRHHAGYHHLGNTMARILIVDDSPTEMYKFTSILEKHGHQVFKAENGADGVALARQEKPDAVLMDIVMPGLNGFQATRQLSKDDSTRHIPVIMITTKDQETDKVWGTRQGARDYLTKPVTEETLINTLNAVLAG